MKQLLKRVRTFIFAHKKLIIILGIAGCIVLVAPSLIVNLTTRSKRHTLSELQQIPGRPVAVVLGAGVLPDNTPTPYLAARVETAVELYKAGRADTLLMSGDNSAQNYNEPTVMQNYAISLGVPAEDIVLDYAGRNTYDTCYRAKHIFGITEALIVTQGYHLPRAVATCNGLGIKTDGVMAIKKGRDFTVNYIARELLSTNKALLQLVIKPKPTLLGNPEPILQ